MPRKVSIPLTIAVVVAAILLAVFVSLFKFIVLAIAILLLMVMIHELGHYLAGKLLNFKINEFAIGMGPKIFSKKRKNGEVFSLRLLPLGGFCAFEDEGEIISGSKSDKINKSADPFDESKAIDGGASDESQAAPQEKQKYYSKKGVELRSFNSQPPWKRIIVLIAGATFNIVSAVIFAVLFISVVGFMTPEVKDFKVSANEAILQKGDIIVAVEGEKVGIMNTFAELMEDIGEDEQFKVTVLRGGDEVELTLTKIRYTYTEKGEEYKGLGIGIGYNQVYQKPGLGYALKYCVPFTVKMSWTILGFFGQLITGKVALIGSLSGPITTVTTIAEYSQASSYNILIFLPLIAVNLGVFNLLPIPALDGSKVIFCLIEWIRKKPINRNVEAWIHFAGFVFILGLVLIVEFITLVTGAGP